MKIVTIIGARPQFMKAAAVSRVLRREHQELFVHTGQHYDSNMSDIFFEELHMPTPDYQLRAGSGSHATQTADMLVGVEDVLQKEKPDAVIVYGDTNSTLAGALAAAKLLIPVIHVEAGLRSYNKMMPEEQNRVLTDHLSDFLFCPTDNAVEHLKKEGITQNVYQVGDVMCDALLYYAKNMEQYGKDYFTGRLKGLYGSASKLSQWYLVTIHRAENTDTIEKLREILSALETLSAPVVFPVHPRIKPMVRELARCKKYHHIFFTEPVGYLDMLFFTKNAIKVITDSGGLQKEAYILNTDCVTIRDQTEWIETLEGNHNILCSPKQEDIVEKVCHTKISGTWKSEIYGDGHAAEKICAVLKHEGRKGVRNGDVFDCRNL